MKLGFGSRIEQGGGHRFEAKPKKKKLAPPTEPEKPTLEDWLEVLPAMPLRDSLTRIKNRRRKKQLPMDQSGAPQVSTPGKTVTTDESRDRSGRVKPHRGRQD